MSAWFEDDTLWESLEGFFFSLFRSPEITVHEAEQILALVHPPQGAVVLDLCCGPGRQALECVNFGSNFFGFRPIRPDRAGYEPLKPETWGFVPV